MSTADDVLRGLLRGLSHRQVADELHLSVHTVSKHARALMHRYGATTDRGLVCLIWAQKCADLEAKLTRSQSVVAALDRRRRES